MIEDNFDIENVKKILTEKYEPILVIQLLRVPPQDELQAFARKLSEDFGYKVLVLPGDFETKVELLSILKSDVTKIDKLQSRVLDLIKKLEQEHEEVLQDVQKDN